MYTSNEGGSEPDEQTHANMGAGVNALLLFSDSTYDELGETPSECDQSLFMGKRMSVQ